LQSSSYYSWSKFGREAEFIVTIYLKLRGWNIQLSKGSKGPADIIASRNSIKWFVQVKSSTRLPRLKGYEVKRLKEMAKIAGGLAVIAILQPVHNTNDTLLAADEKLAIGNIGNYAIFFYSLHDWRRIKCV
jgi:Holliday junction resolvase